MSKAEEKRARIFGQCETKHHDRCKGSYVCTMGVHEGKTMTCECSCHA